MRIYLDVCCLNRPFDDQSQERIRLEAEAVLLIFQHIWFDDWRLISSEIVIDEIEQTPDPHRRERLRQFTTYADESVRVTEPIKKRAQNLMQVGVTVGDALHISCAENARADVFLTTDDRLLRRAVNVVPSLRCRIDNPLHWLLEQEK